MNATLSRINPAVAFALLLLFPGAAAAEDQSTVRAPLQSVKDRKPAPKFALKDVSGKTVQLKDYRGKVVLLDFWATWCTGCKKEIPWFSKIQRMYGGERFAVLGISLDQGGWSVLKPYLADAKVSYRMLLGDQVIAERFGIRQLPDTFLIDQHGRIAAVYRQHWWTETTSRLISGPFSPIAKRLWPW
jgi:peroxiredoxin